MMVEILTLIADILIIPIVLVAVGYCFIVTMKQTITKELPTADEYGLSNIIDEFAYASASRLRLHYVEIDTVILSPTLAPVKLYTYCPKISPRSFQDHDEFLKYYYSKCYAEAICKAKQNKNIVFAGDLSAYYDMMIVRIMRLQTESFSK